MDPTQVLQPWNLIFLLPAVAAVLYLLLLAAGVTAGEGMDLDVDVEADADAAGGGSPLGLLSLIGVGRAPLSLVLVAFGLLWGFLGWVGNLLFGSVVGSPEVAVWPALALALVGAVVLTRGLAIGLGRVMPTTESYDLGARQLVGRIATVRLAAGEDAGTAQLHDDRGTLYEVPVRIDAGERPLPSGSRVVLWRFDEARGAYLVLQDEAIDGMAGGES